MDYRGGGHGAMVQAWSTVDSERSSLVSADRTTERAPRLESSRRDNRPDNRPWGAALACGACLLLLLVVAVCCCCCVFFCFLLLFVVAVVLLLFVVAVVL